jgi:hypothetical protein
VLKKKPGSGRAFSLLKQQTVAKCIRTVAKWRYVAEQSFTGNKHRERPVCGFLNGFATLAALAVRDTKQGSEQVPRIPEVLPRDFRLGWNGREHQ